MKTILAVLVAIVLLPAFSQAQIGTPTPPHDSLKFAYDNDAFSWDPWGDLESWMQTKRVTIGDIVLTGYIDTLKAQWNSDSTKLQAWYHGKPIPLNKCDSLSSKIAYGGHDSATVTSYYRLVKKAANQWYATDWTIWATGATFTNHVSLGSGRPDSLIHITKTGLNIDWNSTQYIQFKHLVVCNKALWAAKTKRLKVAAAGKTQPFWRGQVLITLVRGDQ